VTRRAGDEVAALGIDLDHDLVADAELIGTRLLDFEPAPAAEFDMIL
jgi:hypothetical protein